MAIMTRLMLNIFFLCIACTTTSQNNEQRKYVIGQWPGGLGICITAALCHLAYCEATDKIPVIFWNNKCYLDPQGFNGSKNVWEYYFEPVSELQYRTSDPVHVWLGSEPGYGNFSYYQAYQSKPMRQRAHALIQKYIRLNSIVQSKVDEFYNTYMKGRKTIGIHLRGTNKYIEEKPVSPEKIVAEALKHADDDTQFLLASDDQKLFDRMIMLLKGRNVIYYDCYRSTDGQPLLNCRKPKPSYAQMGEDAIVEMWLLSKSDLFIHTLSNVSSISLYLNPDLTNIILIEKKKNFLVNFFQF